VHRLRNHHRVVAASQSQQSKETHQSESGHLNRQPSTNIRIVFFDGETDFRCSPDLTTPRRSYIQITILVVARQEPFGFLPLPSPDIVRHQVPVCPFFSTKSLFLSKSSDHGLIGARHIYWHMILSTNELAQPHLLLPLDWDVMMPFIGVETMHTPDTDSIRLVIS
jgi:hypothetical protein